MRPMTKDEIEEAFSMLAPLMVSLLQVKLLRAVCDQAMQAARE